MNRILMLATMLAAVTATALAQGPLTPPGAPAPTMKTLDQIEPRTPISSVPFTISAPGSYYLTGNLTITSTVNGITIAASDVHLDLNGFTIAGTTGNVSGITVSGVRANLTIQNGAIRGCGNYGINAQNATHSRFRDLTLTRNGLSFTGAGLQAGGRALVQFCSFVTNNASGVSLGVNSALLDSVMLHNNTAGALLTQNGTVQRCVAISNGADGIATDDDCLVESCVASRNGGRGINVQARCAVRNNLASLNGSDGIEFQDRCLVVGNNSINNGVGVAQGAGLLASSFDNRIEGNHVAGNDVGIRVLGDRNKIFANVASGNTTNYIFAASNTYGPTNVLTGEITSTNPWRNFSE